MVVDLDGGQGDGLSAEIERWQAAVPGPGRRVRRARLRRVGRAIAAFGETGGGRLRDSAARGARAGSRSGSCSGCGRAIPTDASSPSTTRGSTRSGRPPRSSTCRSSSTSPTRSRSSEPLDATQRALGGAPRPPGLALLADRGRAGSRDAPGFPPFDELLGGLRAARRPAPADDVRRRPRRLRRGGPRARRRDCSTRTRTSRVDIAARLGELGRQPYTSRAFFLRYADRILFGVDMAPDPDLYAIHYRFLETFDESFDYGTDAGAGPGPLADPRDRPARRRPAQGLSRQRPPDPPAGAVVTGRRLYRARRAGAGSTPARPSGARSRSSPSTTARTSRKALRPDDPASVTYEEMVDVQAGRRPVPRPGRDRHAAGSRDRRRAVHRRRVAARRGRGSSSRSRRPGYDGSVDGADQPGPRRLERREGEADGRVGGEAPRLLPPRGASNAARPGGARRPRSPADCRAVDIALFVGAAVVLARRRRDADRRGARDASSIETAAAADRDRRRRPQGRVPVRPVGHRTGRAGARPAPSSTRRPRCRGCCCLGRRRRRDVRGARSRPPARPGRAASSSAAPVWAEAATLDAAGAGTRSWRRPAATACGGSPSWSTRAGPPWRDATGPR